MNTSMVLKGGKAIAAYLKVSPATVSRWRRRFRGKTDPVLCLPAVNVSRGVGWSVTLMTSTGLIDLWLARWCEIEAATLRAPPTRRRNAKVKPLGAAQVASAAPAGRGTDSAPRDPVTPNCTCGSTTPCRAH